MKVKKKIKLFTHNDLDGYGCQLVLQHCFETVDVVNSTPGAINPKIEKFINSPEAKTYDIIFITDISVCSTLAKKISIMDLNIVLLDHHDTALYLNKYDWCHVEIDKNGEATCGTSLVYDYLLDYGYAKKEENLFEITEAVRLYDTWLWENQYHVAYPNNLNFLFEIYGGEKFVDVFLDKLQKPEFELFTKFESEIVKLESARLDREIENKNKRLVKVKLKINKRRYKVGVTFAENYVSLIGNKLCDLNDRLDFVIIVNNMATMSFRTNKDDINVSEISSYAFGGGGHTRSAGCQINQKVKDEIIRYLLKK